MYNTIPAERACKICADWLSLSFSLQICESLQSDGWKVEHPNRNAMGPYAYKGNQWVGYDDIDIVKIKVRFSFHMDT
jgi:hypothetical protein